MTLASISGTSQRESLWERQHKFLIFFFGSFSDQFCDSDGGAA